MVGYLLTKILQRFVENTLDQRYTSSAASPRFGTRFEFAQSFAFAGFNRLYDVSFGNIMARANLSVIGPGIRLEDMHMLA